jgi:hypothetical protein
MIKNLFFILSFICLAQKGLAQSDSLDVFRTPSKNKSNNSASGAKGNNSLSISLAHLGRGGTMLTYERFINNTPFAVFAGLGFNKIDLIGQFSLDNEGFYYENDYNDNNTAELCKMIDFGVKYLPEKELGGGYFGLAYSSYENIITQKVNTRYELINSTSSYKLNYNSKEFKVIYGSVNDVDNRFYSDFYIGTGFRLLEYDQLDFKETDSSSPKYDRALEIIKETKSATKLWLFIGWKIGVRF